MADKGCLVDCVVYRQIYGFVVVVQCFNSGQRLAARENLWNEIQVKGP